MVAEREGFEPSVPCGTHDFQSCPFGHSGISPKVEPAQVAPIPLPLPLPLPVSNCRSRPGPVPGSVGGAVEGAGPSRLRRSAEREGFEPPVPLRVHLISNQAQSTRLCHLSINYVAALRRISSTARRIRAPAAIARRQRDDSVVRPATSCTASSPRPPSDCRTRRRRARRAR